MKFDTHVFERNQQTMTKNVTTKFELFWLYKSSNVTNSFQLIYFIHTWTDTNVTNLESRYYTHNTQLARYYYDFLRNLKELNQVFTIRGKFTKLQIKGFKRKKIKSVIYKYFLWETCVIVHVNEINFLLCMLNS